MHHKNKAKRLKVKAKVKKKTILLLNTILLCIFAFRNNDVSSFVDRFTTVFEMTMNLFAIFHSKKRKQI